MDIFTMSLLNTDQKNRVTEFYYRIQNAIPRPLRLPLVLITVYVAVAVLLSFMSLVGIGGQKHGLTDAVSAVSQGIQNGAYKPADQPGLCPEHYPFGMPEYRGATKQGGAFLCRYGFASYFSYGHKAPLWTAEVVSYDGAKIGKQDSQKEYEPDKQVAAEHYTSKRDLLNTEYFERGQMAAEINYSYDYWGRKETALVTNTAPQARLLNRQGWQLLENQVYLWAQDQNKHPDGLLVYSGPLYLGKVRILPDKTPIPSHFYKVVMDRKTGGSTAIVVPNEELPIYGSDGHRLSEEEKKNPKITDKRLHLGMYTVSVRQVEGWSGINFNPVFSPAMAATEATKNVWLPE